MTFLVRAFALLLACLLFFLPVSLATEHNKFVCVNDTANATFELVGGVAAQRLLVKRIIMTTDTAGAYKVQCNGTDVLGPVYLPANGTEDFPVEGITCNPGADEDLDAVKPVAANDATFCVLYDQY